MSRRPLSLFVVVCLAAWIAAPSGQGQSPDQPKAKDDEIIVKFKAGVSDERREAALAAIGAGRIKRFEAVDLDHVRLPRGRKAAEAIAELLAGGDVLSAQPNFIRRIVSAPPPNDPAWLNDGPAGWDFWGVKKIQSNLVWSAPHNNVGNPGLVVADIDTGVDYTHPDLAANMWINPGEIAGNTIDDDANGYVDDVHGINVLTHSGDPMDDHGHGTHTSGTIGARGNNGIGVVGVNWTVKILACKFLAADGFGDDAGAIECFNYITMMKARGVNVRVSNNSWGSYRDTTPGVPFPQALQDAIDTAGNAGILNVFAAGNDGVSIETFPHDPASFTSPSIVSVAASGKTDHLANFSNFGSTSVDLAAPGVGIISTWIDVLTVPTCIDCYAWLDGTSMATPHVAGAAALLLAQAPQLQVSGLKSLLLGNVDLVGALAGGVATGGRLNVFNAANAYAANTAPTVTITSPANGATFNAPAMVTVLANANDIGGSVAQVEFYANAGLLGTDTSSPFSIDLFGMPAGSYSLTARAIDDLGANTLSAPVNITVNGSAGPSISVSPSSVSFSKKQRVGTTSASGAAVSITNDGPGPLVFASFDGGAPTAAFTVAGGEFQGQTNCPLTPEGLAPLASCQFTFQFSPVAAGPRSGMFSIGSNALGSPHSIFLNGIAFIVDEATVNQTIASGGSRLQSLQVNGGWSFRVTDPPCGAPCNNLLGVTALGLLSAFERTGDASTLAAAVDTGDRLVDAYTNAPTQQPFSQDLEFLIALTAASGDPIYAQTADLWFDTIKALHADGAGRADWNFAFRTAEGLRPVAVWDLASTIRSAKAVGEFDYAVEIATRVRDLEPTWQDLDSSYTILGRGSLLWAIHDLQAGTFDQQISDYRAYLLAQQETDGSWDDGNHQTTAYVVLGLAAVGDAVTDAAIESAVAFYIANQFSSNGWPFSPGGINEYPIVDSEILRAVATLFSTGEGMGVTVTPAQVSTVRFSSVTSAGKTTVIALDNVGATTVPFGYSLVGGLSYEVSTSADVSGDATMCIAVPWAATAGAFANVRILHAENGAFVDRTILAGPDAPNAITKRVCAQALSLDAFAVALFDPNAVDSIAPSLNVTLSPSVLSPPNNKLVTVTATITAADNADPAPAIALVSITIGGGDKGKKDDIQDAALGTDDRSFQLRAEKGGNGGRVYTIVYRATDRSGNTSQVARTVTVP